MEDNNLFARIDMLNAIGIALSAEKEPKKLQEMILNGAMDITHADAGTLYILDDHQQLHFKIMHTRSQGVHFGGTTGIEVPLPPVPLYLEDGSPNTKSVAAYSVIFAESINIPNIRETALFDFSGAFAYDEKTGYLSMSFLTIPLKNHENHVIGAIQLLNAQDSQTGEVVPFSRENQHFAESLASQAAITLSNQQLVAELGHLLEKFTEIIATAIDEKSPYTGGHCRRVPELAMMIAEQINTSKHQSYADVSFNDEQMYELRIAAKLHDCGKITTPVHVVDKSTKLETIFDRISLVKQRIEILSRDEEITQLRKQLQDHGITPKLSLNEHNTRLKEEYDFICTANRGGEFMAEKLQQRIRDIGQQSWVDINGKRQSLLTEEEIDNLNITKGTLTNDERLVINHHIISTINMLEALPFPDHLKNVAEIACGHHEHMDGTGYPRGLKREEMSLQARIMGVADIFEALTANDRPYKKAMPLSKALQIMSFFRKDDHIDPDIFELFIQEKVFLRYAKAHLSDELIDVEDASYLLQGSESH